MWPSLMSKKPRAKRPSCLCGHWVCSLFLSAADEHQSRWIVAVRAGRGTADHQANAHRRKIINISSIAGVISLPMSNGAYDASKAGVIHLTRQLAVQWGRFNINVNCISPGYVLTRMMADTSAE